MSKRWTETEKWHRPWFRQLPQSYKLLWLYIIDHCDISGVWYVDIKLANFKLGASMSVDTARVQLAKQIEIFDEGRRWWIKDFVAFQYGVPLALGDRIRSAVYRTLQSHGLSDKISVCRSRTDFGTKDKDNTTTSKPSSKVTGNLFGEEEKRRPPPFTRPTLADIKSYCAERKNTVDPLGWMAYYESNGWRVGRNPMRNWKAAVVTWEKKNGFSNGNGHHFDPDSKEARGASYVPSAEETKKMLREMRTA